MLNTMTVMYLTNNIGLIRKKMKNNRYMTLLEFWFDTAFSFKITRNVYQELEVLETWFWSYSKENQKLWYTRLRNFDFIHFSGNKIDLLIFQRINMLPKLFAKSCKNRWDSEIFSEISEILNCLMKHIIRLSTPVDICSWNAL